MMMLKNLRVPRTIFLLITIGLLNIAAYAKYGGGSGAPEDPYLIYTAEHLNAMGAEPNDCDKHFKLMADIDLTGYAYDRAVIAYDTNDVSWEFEGTPFAGVFDGNSHTISNLTITGRSFLGLFGYLDPGAKITNLTLETVEVNGTGDNIGSLAGINFGSIIMSRSSAAVNGAWWNTGGLTGSNYGSITTSHTSGTVSGGNIGGLVGSNGYGGSITASYSSSTVSSDFHYAGGLAGYNLQGAVIATSYSTGTVTGSEEVGGLAGDNGGSILMSYSTGAVTGNKLVGGLVGSMNGTIVSSFWDMETSGQSTSAGGAGLTTTEMQNIETFINAGWDFDDETQNGTCDYWQISPNNYPILRYNAASGPVMPEGSGTADEPYLIRDARDLGTVWLEPLAHYCLEVSVDLSGISWPMAVVPWFGGTFDGNDYVISNLHIRGIDYLGMIGQSGPGATISNLGLEAVDVNGTGEYIGGLLGHNGGSLVTTSYVTGTVRGIDSVGGLAGWNNYGSITNCYSSVMVSGSEYVGGLVGENYDIITASYSTGTVTGDEDTGGLAGDNWGGTITASYSTGRVNGHEQAGGLVGSNSGDITASYSTGEVSGHETIGGLIGSSGGNITACYSTGKVDGHEDTGGLVGGNVGNISACYSTGLVSAQEYAGGLVGYNRDGIITSSFWDMKTSGQSKSQGGQGKTTAEMQTAGTFLEAGWDFADETANGTEDIWWILEGQDYPRLWWEDSDL